MSLPDAGGGVERLGHRDEGDAVGVKQLHELGEVGERPGQAIDLVDDHNVDPALSDVSEQLLQAGSVQAAAGEAAVVVMISDQSPSFVGLALDVGLRGLPLSMKRVELLFEPIVSRDASVDRATLRLDGSRLHWTLSPASVVALDDDDDEPRAARGRLIRLAARQNALDFSRSSVDHRRSSLARTRSRRRTPKNRWPFHFVPVMAKATADRLA